MSENFKQKIVPQLRFPGFSNSKEWCIEPMGNLFIFLSTNSLSRDKLNYESGQVKNIHYGDIHTKFQTRFKLQEEKVPYINESELIDKIKPDSYCLEGDMVFADASEDMKDIGKSIEIVDLSNEKLISGLHTILARPKNKTFAIGFLGYLFQSLPLRFQIQKEAQGAKVLGISGRKMSKIDILYPEDKKEQQKIFEIFSALDDLILAVNQKINNLNSYKRGLFQLLFPTENKKVPRLRFPKFKKSVEWVEKELGNMVGISSGYSPSKYNLSNTGIYPFVKVEDLNNCTKYQENSRQYSDDSKGVVSSQSIIFPKRGAAIALNKIRITSKNILMDTNMMALTPSEDLNVEFLYYYLNYLGLANIADSSTIPQINNKHIVPFKILVPDPKEQQLIADCLASLDSYILEEVKTLNQLKDHKKGLIQQLFPTVEGDC